MDERILNAGLHLAMEFGENWLCPIQERLAGKFPELSRDGLNKYERMCREVMTFGHEQVPARWREARGNEAEALRLFKMAMRDRYPWVTDENLSHLFSQGCYYAWKNGEMS